MSNQGTIRLKVTNGAPSIEKLWNGRYRLEFLCDNNSPKEDWYYDNISSILPDYGILQETNFGSGVSEDWEAIPSSVYPDMRLVEAEYAYVPSIGDMRVRLTYETLTDQFVREKENNVDYDLNGLRRVTTSSVALPDAPYSKNIGGDTLTDGGISCILASVKVEKTDAKWTREEVWIEPGVLSETEDRVGTQKSIAIESIGEVPTAPPEYVLANTRLSDVGGLTTTRYTFLKPGILSSVISEENGGNTTTGKIRTEVIESFNQVPVTTIDGVLIGKQVSNFEGIPTNRYTFVKADGSIRTSTRPAPASLSGCTYITVESVGIEITPPGVITEASEINEDGFVRWVKTALQGTVTGIKQEYKDVMEVDVPGTVDCTTVAVESGGIVGTIAVTDVVPRRRKKIIANVEIKVSSVSESIAQLAFDLGQVSCSVSTTNYSLQKSPNTTLVYTNTEGGTTSVTGENRNFSAGASIQSYPGCYLTNPSSTGSVAYAASTVPVLTTSGTSHAFNTVATSRTTKCVGSGSTNKLTYFETGVIKRNSRPIFTALNGTTYYEVITWSA